MLNQLTDHLERNHLHELYQSGYKKCHSVETALLKILNDIYIAKENKQITILCLIDLSAAFDTIDHTILFETLKTKFKVTDFALEWIKSYLTNRKQKVQIDSSYSQNKPLHHGIPQGTLLGPLIFSLYLLPLYDIFKSQNIHFHGYADDTQFYLSTSIDNLHTSDTLIAQIVLQIENWLSAHMLKMNPSKTELIVFGCNEHLTVKLTDEEIVSRDVVRNLGIYLDKNLTFEKHFDNLCRNMYNTLRNISRNRMYMTDSSCKTMVTSLVLSKINFCCTLFFGLPQKQINRLQKLQNYAIRLVKKIPKYEHITEHRRELKWLTVESFIKFRYLCMAHDCFYGNAPLYLKNELEKHVPSRPLRTTYENTFKLPLIRSEFGRQSFKFITPKLEFPSSRHKKYSH